VEAEVSRRATSKAGAKESSRIGGSGGKEGSHGWPEESIAKQTEDRMKELFDMELVGDNSSAELTRGQSRCFGILPEELEQHVQTAQIA
jgi:hypothetical protein